MWNEVAEMFSPACQAASQPVELDGETPGWAFGRTAIQFKRGGSGGGGGGGGSSCGGGNGANTSNVVRQLFVAGECPVADPRTAEP